jgi:hypothetical protein
MINPPVITSVTRLISTHHQPAIDHAAKLDAVEYRRGSPVMSSARATLFYICGGQGSMVMVQNTRIIIAIATYGNRTKLLLLLLDFSDILNRSLPFRQQKEKVA